MSNDSHTCIVLRDRNKVGQRANHYIPYGGFLSQYVGHLFDAVQGRCSKVQLSEMVSDDTRQRTVHDRYFQEAFEIRGVLLLLQRNVGAHKSKIY